MNDFAQGIKEGLIGLQTINQQKMQQQQFNVLHGTQTGESGNLEYKPEIQQQMEQQRKVQALKGTQEMTGYDANSIDSKNARDLGRGLLKKSLGISDLEASKYIPDTMSKNEILGENGLIGKGIAGGFGMQGAQAKASGFQQMADVRKSQFEETQNKHSSDAGQAFESNQIMKQIKTTQNNLARANSLLNGKEPITAKSFNILQQDFINAMAPGGAATEGKVNRELITTGQEMLNDIQLKFGNVKDLRTEQPQVFNHLKSLINQINGDYSEAQATQAKDIHDSFANSANPKVLATIRDKLKRYAPAEYNKLYGGGKGLIGQQQSEAAPSEQGHPEDSAAVQWAKANPKDPRAIGILKANGAL